MITPGQPALAALRRLCDLGLGDAFMVTILRTLTAERHLPAALRAGREGVILRGSGQHLTVSATAFKATERILAFSLVKGLE